MPKSPIEMMMDGLEWKACEPRSAETLDADMPHATHSGELRIGNNPPIRCYRLSNGMAVFDADDVKAFFETL